MPEFSEQVTFLKLSSLVRNIMRNTRRLVLFYVDENLMGEIQKFNRLIFDQGRKYDITVEEWKRTKMCKDLYHYAENYRLYESVFYWNNSPPAVAEQISKILELQKEIINFTLLPATLIETEVADIEPDYRGAKPNYFRLLFNHALPDKRTRIV